MTTPSRAEVLRRSRDAYREYGRDFIVMLDDREEPHYGFLPELEELLEDEPEAETLIASLALALRIYVPERASNGVRSANMWFEAAVPGTTPSAGI